MRFAFGEDEVKRIAKAVKAFEQDQGSSGLQPVGPRHLTNPLSLVKVTKAGTPFYDGKKIDFDAANNSFTERDDVKIKEINNNTLTLNRFYGGFFSGYKEGLPVFIISAGANSNGGNAVIDVVSSVTCTPSGIEVSKITLSGADYDNAVIRNFLALSDVTPKSFLGNQGRVVKVNDQGNALEFGAIVTGNETTFISLTDTPAEYGQKNTYKVLTVSSSNNAITFSDNEVQTDFSVSGGGNPNNPNYKTITLVNDVKTPEQWQFYGTNGAGVRGWFDVEGHQTSKNSVIGTGTFLNPIQLKNDEEAPGANKYYGTNDKGDRGWLETAFTPETLHSITGDGTAADPIKLVNDLEAPSSNHFYGTDSNGIKGWFASVTFNYVDAIFDSIDARVAIIENAPYATQGYVTTAVGNEANDRSNADIALDGRITTLESSIVSINASISTINGNITAIQSDISNITGDISTINSTLTTVQANITILQSDVGTLQNTVSGHTTDISNLQTSINTETTNRTNADNALDGRIGTLESQNLNSRLTTAEGSITTLQGQMTTAQADIISLDGRVDILEGQTLNTRLTTAEGLINTLQGDVTGLDSRLTTAEGNIIGIDGRLSTLESQTLDTRLATLEGQTLDTRLTTLENQTLDTRLSTIESQTLDTRVTTLEGQTLDTRITTLEGQTLDTRLTTLEGQTLDTRLTTLEGQTLDTRLTAIETYDLDTRVTILEGYVTSSALTLGGVQVVGTQQAAVADAVGGTIDDTDVASCASSAQVAINDLTAQINEVLAALRAHGLIAT